MPLETEVVVVLNPVTVRWRGFPIPTYTTYYFAYFAIIIHLSDIFSSPTISICRGFVANQRKARQLRAVVFKLHLRPLILHKLAKCCALCNNTSHEG